MANSEQGPRDKTLRTPGQQGFSWIIPGGSLEIGEEVWSDSKTIMRTRSLVGTELRLPVITDAARTVVEFDVD
jgi:hypothetical protein